MTQQEQQAAVAAFIRSKGITRCPTVCLLPTHGTAVSAADRAALRRADAAREQRRLERQEAIRRRLFAIN